MSWSFHLWQKPVLYVMIYAPAYFAQLSGILVVLGGLVHQGDLQLQGGDGQEGQSGRIPM